MNKQLRRMTIGFIQIGLAVTILVLASSVATALQDSLVFTMFGEPPPPPPNWVTIFNGTAPGAYLDNANYNYTFSANGVSLANWTWLKFVISDGNVTCEAYLLYGDSYSDPINGSVGGDYKSTVIPVKGTWYIKGTDSGTWYRYEAFFNYTGTFNNVAGVLAHIVVTDVYNAVTPDLTAVNCQELTGTPVWYAILVTDPPLDSPPQETNTNNNAVVVDLGFIPGIIVAFGGIYMLLSGISKLGGVRL